VLRLLLYWCAAALLLLPVVGGHYWLWFDQAHARARFSRAQMTQFYPPSSENYPRIVGEFGSFQAFLDRFAPLPPAGAFYRKALEEEGRWTIYLALLWLAWPWLVLVVLLLLFRFSMRRARIRSVHVLRCVVYSADAVAWLALVAAVALGLRALDRYGLAPNELTRLVPAAPLPSVYPYEYRSDIVSDTLFWGGVGFATLMAYRLTRAFRHYLRFDHPTATVVCAHVVAVLALILLVVEGWPVVRNWW
jgi:hypothetical protein